MLCVFNHNLKSEKMRTSLAIQWFKNHASNARGIGSIPGWGTKILYAMWYSPKNKK